MQLEQAIIPIRNCWFVAMNERQRNQEVADQICKGLQADKQVFSSASASRSWMGMWRPWRMICEAP
jgi:hypothetical protein